jgi:hypothetical protein
MSGCACRTLRPLQPGTPARSIFALTNSRYLVFSSILFRGEIERTTSQPTKEMPRWNPIKHIIYSTHCEAVSGCSMPALRKTYSVRIAARAPIGSEYHHCLSSFNVMFDMEVRGKFGGDCHVHVSASGQEPAMQTASVNGCSGCSRCEYLRALPIGWAEHSR